MNRGNGSRYTVIIESSSIYIYIYIYIYTHIRLDSITYIYIYIYIYTHTYGLIRLHIYIYIHGLIRLHIYIYISTAIPTIHIIFRCLFLLFIDFLLSVLNGQVLSSKFVFSLFIFYIVPLLAFYFCNIPLCLISHVLS